VLRLGERPGAPRADGPPRPEHPRQYPPVLLVSETPTAGPSAPPRPRPTSTSTGPCPPTCGPGDAPRRQGRPSATSSQDNRDHERVNGATFPSPHPQPSQLDRQPPNTSSTHEDLGQPISHRESNQVMASQVAAPARATIAPAAVRPRRAGNDGRRWLRSTSTQPDAHLGALGARHRAVLVEGRGVTGEVVVSSSDHRAAQLVRVRDEGAQQPGAFAR